MLRVNLTNSAVKADSYVQDLQQAHTWLQEATGRGSDFVGWVNLPKDYDKEEFARAMEWVEKYCKPNEGSDCNPAHLVYSREQKDVVWEYVVKMTLIFRDLMHGNPKLAEMGFEEEAMGHNAIAGGFQGQRQWTDFRPDGDFPEAILNSSFDWNGIREAVTFATENDTLNGASMLLLHLLTNRAQLFADVRTFWSPEAVERVTGRRLTGRAAGGIIHLINSGSCTLDATGQQSDAAGNPAMKPFWDIRQRGGSMSPSHDMVPGRTRIHARRRILVALPHPRRNADDHVPLESRERTRPRIADRRRLGRKRR